MRAEVDLRGRLAVIGLVVVALFAGLLTRLWFLQVAGGESLAVAAATNSGKTVQVPALRGRILDAEGRVLAETRAVTTLTVDRQLLTTAARATLVENLAGLLGTTPDDVGARIDDPGSAPFEPVVVAQSVTDDQAQFVWEHRSEFPRTRVTSTFQRVYPYGPLAAHVVGYTGRINAEEYEDRRHAGYTADEIIGKTGIEQTFETVLRGKPERKRVRVDNRGLKIGESVIRKAVPGRDVQLTIDLDAQRIAEESLAQGMEGARRLIDPDRGGYYRATGGAIAVLDARTGAVVALASAPTFDPNVLVHGGPPASYFDPAGELPLINRALSGYAPGSTFKLFTSIATLEYGIRTAGETYYDQGCFEFGNKEEICNARKAAYGIVDLPRALTVSSDTFFYNAGNEFWNVYRDEGQDGTNAHPVGYGIHEIARRYGFGAPTGVALAGDATGRIPDLTFRQTFNEKSPDPTDRTWRRGDSANLAVGQGDVLVTPLQLANGYAAFANGGSLHTPQLVGALHKSAAGLPEGQMGEPVPLVPAPAPRDLRLTPEVREPIMAGLRGAATNSQGTAYWSFNTYDGPSVAGKTGTAQVAGKQDTSWFAGILNADNAPDTPQYVVVAMVEQGGFGSEVAAPVVRRVIDFLSGDPEPADVNYSPAPRNARKID